MRLLIAEKPDMARRYAAAVGATERREGYMEGSGWLVSWALGHLLQEAMPHEYPQWADARRWDYSELPFIPGKWLYVPRAGDAAARQLSVLGRLMARGDVDCVVNACDPDREGEGIFWLIAEHCGLDKPVMRLWSTSLEESHMRRDIEQVRPASEYKGLADAARGRAWADWLIGINGTRAYTTTYRRHGKGVVAVGRVKTCVLAEVAERCRRHDAFKSEPFWRSALTLDGFTAEGEQRFERGLAEGEVARAREAGAAIVRSVERAAKKSAPPKLYDITELQRDASTRCGMSADATLAAAQSCYERAILTYPRTPSRYIGSDTADEAAAVLAHVADAAIVGADVAAAFDASRADIKRVVKDSAVQGHPALMPTASLTAEVMERLSADERNVMTLVCGRLLAAVSDRCDYTVTRAELAVGDDLYSATGTVVSDPAWRAVDDAVRRTLKAEADDGADGARQEIPLSLVEGDEVGIRDVELKEGKTSPPKFYTVAELLGFMKNPSRKIRESLLKDAIREDSTHSAGIGTPATRDAILKDLFSRKLLAMKGRSVVATEEGRALVDVLGDSVLCKPELTATWELELSRVEAGETQLSEFVSSIEELTRKVVKDARDQYDPDRAAAFGADIRVGECPRCGADLILRDRSVQCSTNRRAKKGDGTWELTEGCGFSLSRTIAKKRLTESQVRQVLAGKTVRVKGLSGRRGPFDAGVRINDAKDGYEFVFDDHGGAAKGRKRKAKRP